MKSVLIAIQPYYVFLIIAHLMGWNIPENKTVEVRKNFPQDLTWDKVAYIYCSKNRKSFNRIPTEYQPLMAKFLGKVIGEFVCDRIEKIEPCFEYYSDGYDIDDDMLPETCLTREELMNYGKGKPLYGWHISDLKICDKPKELGEFSLFGFKRMGYSDCMCANEECKYREKQNSYLDPPLCEYSKKGQKNCQLTRPPQSWCYVEEV